MSGPEKPFYFHSVALLEDKCRGCTSCISTCPTEAIRVRKGKARIILERCIDCGECIRVCPSHAKIADTDSLDILSRFDYTVAIPAPSLFGQFKDAFPPDIILTALKRIGFDDVFEVAAAAHLVAGAIHEFSSDTDKPRPLISSSCPAVVRLISVRFPSLLRHLTPIKSPMEMAGRFVRDFVHPDKKNLGIFFITPCPAKRTSIKASLSVFHSSVDGAIAVRDLYPHLLRLASEAAKQPEKLSIASGSGYGWAGSDGEAASIGLPRTLTVDGIHRVVNLLELMENGELAGIDFIEAMACPGGCVGGPLNAENPSVARTRIRELSAEAPSQLRLPAWARDLQLETFLWEKDIIPGSVMPLDNTIEGALEKMKELDKLLAALPGLDCGACGSPSCHSLAEDIVRGSAEDTDCVFILRERIRKMSLEMFELQEKLPPPLSRDEDPKEKPSH